MASGHRKRKAALLRAEVLTPAGLTNASESDRGKPVNQNDLFNLSVYSSGGYSPSFTEGSTTLLADAVSGQDYVWQYLGYDGETSANAAYFFGSNSIHRYIPYAGESQRNLTDSTAVVLYSKDGPTTRFNQFYAPVANQVNGTGSIVFSSAISGAAGSKPKLGIYVGGAFPTASIGATLTILSGSTVIMTYASSSSVYPTLTTASFPAAYTFGINAATNGPPSSGDSIKFTFPAGYAGLTASVDYTVTFTSSVSSPLPTGFNAYISGSTTTIINNVILKLVNQMDLFSDGTTGTTGSATAWSNFASYVSGSGGGSNGVSVFARQPGLYGRQIAVSGSNNKIKKTAGVDYFRFEPYVAYTSFNTASMGTLTVRYSSSADTATLNSWSPGLIVYITGSDF